MNMVSGQFHSRVALPPGKSPRYPLDRRLGETRSGLCTVKKRKMSSTYPVAIGTELSRLLDLIHRNKKNFFFEHFALKFGVVICVVYEIYYFNTCRTLIYCICSYEHRYMI
jgi:hypothetical protein